MDDAPQRALAQLDRLTLPAVARLARDCTACPLHRFAVPFARAFAATVHPSSILRGPAGRREEERAAFMRDLRRIAGLARAIPFPRARQETYRRSRSLAAMRARPDRQPGRARLQSFSL